MENGISVRKSVMSVVIALGMVALMTGCATKKYVQTSVDNSAHELSARIDNAEQTIKSNQSQVAELGNVTREHSQKIATLDTGVKQADSKAQQAMQTGQGAQNTANKAVGQVSELDTKFQNRNHYVSLTQQEVRFKFNSAKLDDASKGVLDQIAQQIKQNPDAILEMEGHTDATGSAGYNMQLGQKRLQAVVRYLVIEQDVPMNRISDLSFGEEKPLASNRTREGRAQNRSVVVRVMGPQLTSKGGMVSQAQDQ